MSKSCEKYSALCHDYITYYLLFNQTFQDLTQVRIKYWPWQIISIPGMNTSRYITERLKAGLLNLRTIRRQYMEPLVLFLVEPCDGPLDPEIVTEVGGREGQGPEVCPSALRRGCT